MARLIRILTGGAVLCAVAVAIHLSPPAAAAAPLTEPQAEKIGTDAYVYGIALLEFVRQAKQQTSVTIPNDLSDAPVNQLGNARSLATARQQVIVAPNNDTLYSMAHLDLSRGALVLHVPAVPGHRYYSFEFLDPYTNVFHYVGTRTTGDGAGDFAIVGPKFKGRLPRGLRRITASYEHVWLVGRTLVYGPGDLRNVHTIQNGYRLTPLTAFERVGLSYTPPRPRRIVTKHTVAALPSGIAFFDALGDALAQNPPPKRDAAILRELASVGIGPGLHPSSEQLPAAVLSGLAAAAAAGPATISTLRTTIAAPSVLTHSGWFVPPPDIGAYGTDYPLRAIVSVYGIAANRPAEALYPVGAFGGGALLNGAHRYMIHFPAGGLPPARYFWSITMYNHDLFLVTNPLNRYAIGNRTPGVKHNKDGSLDIYLQSTPPAGHKSNWLPSPSSGVFEVIMRLYGPRRSALDGTYRYPPIALVGS